MTKLSEIEGIGPAFEAKLNQAGVRSIEALREMGATPAGRAELEAASGIGSKQILEWVNHADLFRIKGVGSEYSDLLEEAGVVPWLNSRPAMPKTCSSLCWMPMRPRTWSTAHRA